MRNTDSNQIILTCEYGHMSTSSNWFTIMTPPVRPKSASQRRQDLKKEHVTLAHKLRVIAHVKRLKSQKVKSHMAQTISYFKAHSDPLDLNDKTIYRWLKTEESIQAAYNLSAEGEGSGNKEVASGRKKARTVKNPQVEEALRLFCQKMLDSNLPCSSHLLKHKLQQYQERLGGEVVKGSNGWVESFCRS